MRVYPGLAALLCLAGCGAGEVKIGEFFPEAEAAYCGWAARCGAVADAASCRDAYHFDVLYPLGLLASGGLIDESRFTVEYLLAAHQEGRISFDAQAAGRCLEHVAGRGCARPEGFAPSDEELAGRASCAAIFTGTLADGDLCAASLECAGGGYCQQDTCEDGCCVGECVVPTVAARGESCSVDYLCGAGLGCVYDEGAQDYLCSPLMGEGEPCGGELGCAEGLVCDWSLGLCVAQGAVGEVCTSFGGASCLPGGVCVDPEFDGTGRCQALGDVGDPCDVECRDFDLLCEGGVCVKAPPPGEPCTPSGGCSASSRCNFNTMICVADVGEGEPCGSDAMGATVACAGDLQCDGGSLAVNKCLAPHAYPCPVP